MHSDMSFNFPFSLQNLNLSLADQINLPMIPIPYFELLLPF